MIEDKIKLKNKGKSRSSDIEKKVTLILTMGGMIRLDGMG